MVSPHHSYTIAALFAALASGPAVSAAAGVPDPLARPALRAERLQSRVFLSIARAGNRIVAVGERGLIALSDDAGKTWRQSACPVSVTLTAVNFADALNGWAVGHAGVVLHSADGGVSWKLQLDGKRAAAIAVAAAVATGAENDAFLKTARQLAADGPDKPFLDVQFSDARHGIVSGAYGLLFATRDGGNSWQSLMQQLPNPRGLHLYAVRTVGDAVWVAGEQGFLALSRDSGTRFARIDTPYRGSYFTMLPLGRHMLIAGLKGNAFEVDADSLGFRRLEGAPPISFSSAAALRDGRLVFTNQAGQVLLADGAATGLRALQLPASGPHGPLSAVLEAHDGRLVTAGANGIARISGPASELASTPVRK
jgi:photosystem II stability/assembly factor-like uncharacterized protein